MGECTPEDDVYQVYALHVCVHHLHTGRTYSHHWRQQSTIPLSSRFFHGGCGNVPQITAECNDTSLIHYAQHVQQSVYMSIQLPADIQCDPFKWPKLFNRSMYSSEGHGCTLEWMLQTLFTSQSTTVTACRVKIEGAKKGLLNAIRLLMTMTNELLTLQSLGMHILYLGANEHSPWGCCFFFSAVYKFLNSYY